MIRTKPKERWRWVRRHRNFYKVSTWGRVKSVRRVIVRSDGKVKTFQSKLLSPASNGSHYYVWLHKAGKKTKDYIHRLVLEAFVGPCPDGMEGRHYPDRDPQNNCIWNLSWGTPQQNTDDMEVHGTRLMKEQHPQAFLTERAVRKIRRLASKGWPHTKIAKKMGLLQRHVGKIVRKEIWK